MKENFNVLVGTYRPEKEQLQWILGEKPKRSYRLYNIRRNADLFSQRNGGNWVPQDVHYLLLYNYSKLSAAPRMFRIIGYEILSEDQMLALEYPNPQGSYIVYQLGEEYDVSSLQIKTILKDNNKPFMLTSTELRSMYNKEITPIEKMKNSIKLDNSLCADFLHGVDTDLLDYSKCSGDNEPELRMLSLFSGCGGMDLGFEGKFICHKASVGNPDWIDHEVSDNWVMLKKNRFKTIFANDILDAAQASWQNYMQRFSTPKDVYHFGSIVDYVKAYNNGTNLFPADVDIVTGGFPCQDFSIAGKRMGFDSMKTHDGQVRNTTEPSEETRGKLYFWMKQVIDIVRPKVFIAENVKGLVTLGDVKDIIQHDFASADGNGYIVLDPQVLHAGDYGVPESRERVIFIGIRRDALKPEVLAALESNRIPDELYPYPPQTHHYNAFSTGQLKPVSCRQVFEGLLEPEQSPDLTHSNYSHAHYMGKHCQGQSEINIDGLGPTIRSEHHGNIEYRRLSPEHGGRNEIGMPERRLTPRECALIQTFPPDYPFVVKKEGSRRYDVNSSGAYKVIGNAVPPMLAYNIARRLQELWPVYFN